VTEIQPFVFPETGQPVRTVTIDSEPWFVGRDVCAVLDIAKPENSLALLDEDERGTHTVGTLGGDQVVTVINEPGLYSLILRSRKPQAKAFKRWVTHEVIPSIRRTGSYSVATAPEIPATYAAALRVAAEQAERAELAEAHVAELAPAAQAWDSLAETKGDYSVRDAAQILDRDPLISTGQNRLFAYMRDLGWIDANGTPYQNHVDCGRLAQRTTAYTHPHKNEPVLTSQVRITPKGLAELHKRLGGFGDVRGLVAA
jgi:anti-repressor protein